jgi:hypothetical protein
MGRVDNERSDISLAMQPLPATSVSDVSSSGARQPPTALHLVNNGISVNTPGHHHSSNPHIFRTGPQILKVPTARPRQPAAQPAPAASSERRKEYERVFGHGQTQFRGETTNAELSRPQIHTVRQLQRALQNKILQTARPAGLTVAFHKIATNRVMTDEPSGSQAAVDFHDLRRAIDTFNLHASDELVGQLLSTLDADHDGLLRRANASPPALGSRARLLLPAKG